MKGLRSIDSILGEGELRAGDPASRDEAGQTPADLSATAGVGKKICTDFT